MTGRSRRGEAGHLTDAVIQNAAFEDANAIFEQAKAAKPGPEQDALWRKAGEDVRGRAARRSGAQGRACRRHQLGVLLQAGRRVQPRHRPLPALHQQLRERGPPRSARSRRSRPEGPEQGEGRAESRRVQGARSSTSGWRTTRSRPRTTASSPTRRRPSRSRKIATNPRFDDARRANASHIAMVLYSNLGDRANMTKMYDILGRPEDAAHGPKARRGRLPQGELRLRPVEPERRRLGRERVGAAARPSRRSTQFHGSNKDKPESARFALESAYRIAKMMQATRGRRVPHLVQDDDRRTGSTSSPTRSRRPRRTASRPRWSATDAPYSDYGGEADFTLVRTSRSTRDFDYATDHHHYAGIVSGRHQAPSTRIWARPRRRGGRRSRRLRRCTGRSSGQRRPRLASARSTTRSGPGWTSSCRSTSIPKQQALIDKLQKIVDQLNAAGQTDKADQVQQQIDDTQGPGPRQVARDQGQVHGALQPEDGLAVRHGGAHRAEVQREEQRGAERRLASGVTSPTSWATTR